jgi:hypothetical protein
MIAPARRAYDGLDARAFILRLLDRLRSLGDRLPRIPQAAAICDEI